MKVGFLVVKGKETLCQGEFMKLGLVISSMIFDFIRYNDFVYL